MEHIEEMCLMGACNRGISYVGCFKKFEELDILKLKKIVGISIGSFLGLCYIIGYKSDELFNEILNKEFEEFKDFAMDEHGAVLQGKTFRKWVYDIVSKKIDPEISMLELYKKFEIHFVISTTCLISSNKNFSEGTVYMSHEFTPDIPVITAINASMAFPIIFPPVCYEDAEFIDGGILDNIPSGFLSKDAVCISVNFKKDYNSSDINNPVSYMGKIFDLMSNRIDQLKGEKILGNKIAIPCNDFDFINFDMTIDDKITLYNRGYKATEKYLRTVHSMTQNTAEI